MPELPEVETIRQKLRQGKGDQPPVMGRTILEADLFWPRTLATPAPATFQERVAGQPIAEIGRRGKYLIFNLDPDFLLFHLRMSGDMLVEAEDAPLSPYTRLALHLDDNLRLEFFDTRKFGRAWLVNDPEEVLSKLGPEPLDDPFTPEWLYENLSDRRRLLKPLLLDQTFIAGLGNIYVDEALHRAGLHPLTLSNHVTQGQSRLLWESIRHVLLEGIERQGASIDWLYRGGDFQNYFRVHQRKGLPCPTCGTPVEKTVVGQRGTYFCPHCQPVGNIQKI